jgi:hypothetical protein
MFLNILFSERTFACTLKREEVAMANPFVQVELNSTDVKAAAGVTLALGKAAGQS